MKLSLELTVYKCGRSVARFLGLQRKEFESEQQIASNRLISTSKSQLVSQGFCIADVAGTWVKKTVGGFQTASFAFPGKGNRKFVWNRLT